MPNKKITKSLGLKISNMFILEVVVPSIGIPLSASINLTDPIYVNLPSPFFYFWLLLPPSYGISKLGS